MSEPSLLVYNQYRDRAYHFTGYLRKTSMDDSPASGSVSFGLIDITTGNIVTESIVYASRITPTLISGSIDLGSSGVVHGNTYRPFNNQSSNSILTLPNHSVSIDETSASGSLAGGDLYVNAGGLGAHDPDGYIFFSKAVGDGHDDEARWIRWGDSQPTHLLENGGAGTFQVSHSLVIGDSTLVATNRPSGRLILNPRKVSTHYDSDILFSGSTENKSCRFWYIDSDSVGQNCYLNQDLNMVNATITVPVSGSHFNTLTATNDIYAGGDITSANNMHINYNGVDSDSYLYFYEDGSTTGAYLMWDDDPGQFVLNKSTYVSGFHHNTGALITDDNLYVNYSGGDGDSYLYFYENSSTTGASLKWDDANDRFELSDALIVTDNIASHGNAYVNFDGADGDSYLYFYEGSSATGAYLMWDDDPASFVFNKSIKVGDTGANYAEIKNDGEINLHGTARVTNHLRVSAPSWKIGAVGPTAGYVGIIPSLDFDASSDDSVHYSLMTPLRMATGTDIEIAVDWCYTGLQDAGTVRWALEYQNLPSGSIVAGSTSTIAESSPANQIVGRLIRTTFGSKITGAIAHDIIGLRLYRDVSGDNLGTDAKLLQTHFMFTTDKIGMAT